MHCKAVVQPFANVQVVLLFDATMKGTTGQSQFRRRAAPAWRAENFPRGLRFLDEGRFES
jgi:hypothetical protein